jgi:RNA polymerase sigma factor (sigma-70 family)
MRELDDHELLGEFARDGSEPAFAALVTRHVNLVHSAAFRFTGDSHHAEEITQAVFIILARKAGKISSRVVLSGWLYQVARLTAANFMKGEIRRQRREQEACMQSSLNEPDTAAWKQIAPWLDEAMGSLGKTDRDAVVLRYFENKSAAEIGDALRMNEETARRRVNRAVEKLRKFFMRRNLALPAAVLTAAISANSVHAAPAAIAKSVTAVAIAKGVGASASTLTLIQGTLKLMAWSKAKIALIAGVAIFSAAGLRVVAIKDFDSRTHPGKMPAFAAEGFVSSIFYRNSSDTNNFIKSEGKVSFVCSDDVWRIQFTYQKYIQSGGPSSDDEQIIGETLDNKRVPGGIRKILIPPPSMKFNPGVFTPAFVRPDQFPEWGYHELYVPWLSLWPNPELPLTGSGRIHFAMEPELYGNPRNVGSFFASYRAPDGFLSELVLTNSGVRFTSDGRAIECPEPYKNGYVEFSFKVLETTNCGGITFPLKTVLTQFIPSPKGKSADDLIAVSTTEFSVQHIDIGADHLAFVPLPDRVMAFDTRPPGLSGDGMHYNVTNDQYFPLTNPRLRDLAKIYGRPPMKGRTRK